MWSISLANEIPYSPGNPNISRDITDGTPGSGRPTRGVEGTWNYMRRSLGFHSNQGVAIEDTNCV